MYKFVSHFRPTVSYMDSFNEVVRFYGNTFEAVLYFISTHYNSEHCYILDISCDVFWFSENKNMIVFVDIVSKVYSVQFKKELRGGGI